jgi:hypothetical protein
MRSVLSLNVVAPAEHQLQPDGPQPLTPHDNTLNPDFKDNKHFFAAMVPSRQAVGTLLRNNVCTEIG